MTRCRSVLAIAFLVVAACHAKPPNPLTPGATATTASPGGLLGRKAPWTKVLDPAFGSSEPQAILSTLLSPEGGPWLGVGVLSRDLPRAHAGVVWTSTDGAKWARAELPSRGSPPQEEAVGAARRDDVTLVVGRDTSGPDDDAAVWRQQAGGPWERIDHPALSGEGIQRMSAVTAGPAGFTATGGVDVGAGLKKALWYSPDGRGWLRVVDSELANVQGHLWVAGSASGVVMTALVFEGFTRHTQVWFSSDGAHFQRTKTFEKANNPDFLQVRPFRGGFVAAGSVESAGGKSAPEMWTSPDGRSWSPVPADRFADPRIQRSTLGAKITSLATSDSWVFAAADDGFEAAAWVSSDLVNWEKFDLPETLVEPDRLTTPGPAALAADQGKPGTLMLSAVIDGKAALYRGGGRVAGHRGRGHLPSPVRIGQGHQHPHLDGRGLPGRGRQRKA